MRFSSVRLTRYGHFDDRVFDFPRSDGAPDIHLVVGENEAGKTTLRHALADFLFGFSAGSPFAFGGGKPAVAAEVEIGGRKVALERQAGSKGLKPPDTAPLLEEALNGFDRRSFLATQAFSHDEMREHSRLLQESRGQLKELLERDAGGLRAVRPLVDALRKEADELYKKHKGHKSNRFRAAEIARDEALRQAGAALTAERHRDLIEAREAAEGRLADLRRAHAAARAGAEGLERERRAEPVVERLQALERRLAALPDVRLAPAAVERVNKAAIAETSALTALEGATARREALQEERDMVCLDEAATVLAADIEDVAERLNRLSHRVEERVDKDAEARAAEEIALSRARSIGHPAEDAESLACALPPAVDRREADRHMRERGGLEQAVDAARKALEEGEAEPPPELPEGPGEALLAALDAIQDLGRYREEWQSTVAAVADAQEWMRRAEEDTAGDCDAEAPPPPEEGAAAETEIETARQALKAAEERVQRTSETVRKCEAAVRRAAADEVPTADVLSAARQRRDALWREFTAGRPVAEAREAYERHVAEADRVADERFEKNTEILAAERAIEDLAEAEREHDAIVAARDACREALEAARGRWAERLRDVGLHTVPVDYRAWYTRRQTRREAAHALQKAQAAADALTDRLRAALRMAVAALGEEMNCDLGGEALLRAIETAAEALKTEKARLENEVAAAKAALEAHETRARDRPRRKQALDDALSALESWHAAWQPLAEQCNVPEDIAPARLADVLDGYRDIENQLGKAAECRRTVAAVDAFEKGLSADVARLAAELGEPVADDVRASGRRLIERLTAARKAAEEAGRLDRALEVARTEEARAAEALTEARRAVAVDREAAGLAADAPAAELAEAAGVSDERHRIAAAVTQARDDLTAIGYSWPDARDVLAVMDAAERAAAAEAAREEADRLSVAVEDALSEATRARTTLERAEADARGGAVDAARARFTAGVHTRAMAEAAAEAIRRRLEIAVLAAARDRFETENRSPILSRASEVFDTFTGGAYDRLERGWGDGQSFVRAHRAQDDAHLDVDSLSDGTRDQLVASVRIAAAHDEALPFIADDLFVNTDDERAANGFRVLAGLAQGRQVIYLTHHAHLEAVARSAVGNALTVLRL